MGIYAWLGRATVDEPVFLAEPMAMAAPPLVMARAGEPVASPEGVHLVHFWATWCGPCVEELPALLAAAEAEGVTVLAVTDEPWPVVARYFDGDVPSAIVQDPTGEALAAWEVSGLPDTYVVRDGRVVARTGGARVWTSAGARAFLGGL